jgi:KRAB domain-containing zinc finger protein
MCTSCGKLFANSDLMRQHVKRVHEKKENVHKCPHCEKLLVSKVSLKGHIEVKHKTLEERCFCEPCNETFESLILKKEHDRIVHNKGTLYQCHKCPKTFLYKTTFDIHLRRENEEKPFPCGKCRKGFVSKQKRDDHYDAVCGGDEEAREKVRKQRRENTAKFRALKKYKCDECGESFGQKPQLVYHKKQKHEEDEEED